VYACSCYCCWSLSQRRTPLPTWSCGGHDFYPFLWGYWKNRCSCFLMTAEQTGDKLVLSMSCRGPPDRLGYIPCIVTVELSWFR
jgi:hypothetical protein